MRISGVRKTIQMANHPYTILFPTHLLSLSLSHGPQPLGRCDLACHMVEAVCDQLGREGEGQDQPTPTQSVSLTHGHTST